MISFFYIIMNTSKVYAVCIVFTNPVDGSTISKALHMTHSRKSAFIAFCACKGLINVPDVSLKIISHDAKTDKIKILQQINSRF